MKIDPAERLAGVLIPVFALRHKTDLGIGDTQAVKEAIDFCARNKIAILQVLPINESGGDNSPYSAISSIALDPALLTLSPDMVPGLDKKDLEKVVKDELAKELRQGAVRYPLVKKLKQQLLRCAFDAFAKANSKLMAEFDEFQRQNESWLKQYTLFRTIMDEKSGNSVWTQWEDELKNYDSALKWLEKHERSADLKAKRRFFAYVQWVAFKQWEDVRAYSDERGIKLMGDIPFGVSRYSADVWAHKDLFDLDWSGGAPPERFFQSDLFTQKWGQNWGVPTYKWEAHEAQNYQWWRQRIGHCTRIFHYFRIDHVLGFFRVYSFPWIPERNWEFTDLDEDEAKERTGGRLPKFLPRSDETPEDAELNEKDGEKILQMVLDAAGAAGVVAEDLGMVPPYVRPLLKKLGIPGFAIPIFERNEEDRSFKQPDELAPLSLATYGTHDHDPLKTYYENLVEWWHGPDGHEGWREVQRLMRFLGGDENNPPASFSRDLHFLFLEVLLNTPCWLTLLMITDLLGTSQRFNEPGIAGEYNWSQRLERTLDEYEKSSDFGDVISYFAKLIEKTGRQPSKMPAGTARQTK